jgi:hypothetical protein
MEKAFAIAGYPKDVLEQRFGDVARPAIWRAAPRRHRAWHRPHRHAALREENRVRWSCFMNQQAEDPLMGAL